MNDAVSKTMLIALRATFMALTTFLIPFDATFGQEYLLQSGDSVHLSVSGEPELNGDYQISMSGMISVPTLGSVVAAGHTVATLEVNVTERLVEALLVNPLVSIQVAEFRPVFVMGDVRNPGRYEYLIGMTVLQAIAAAGGFERPETTRDDATSIEQELHLHVVERRALLARQARLRAELNGTPTLQFPQELIERADSPMESELMAMQKRLLEERRSQLAEILESLDNEVKAVRAEKRALERASAARAEQTGIIERQIKEMKYSDSIARLQVLAVEQSAASVRSERLEISARIAKAEQQLETLTREFDGAKDRYQQDVLIELLNVTAQLGIRDASIKFALAGDGDGSTIILESLPVHRTYSISRAAQVGVTEVAAHAGTRVHPGDVVKVARIVAGSLKETTK